MNQPAAGKGYRIIFKLIQDVTAGRQPTFSDGSVNPTWLDGQPDWSLRENGDKDIVELIHDGTDFFAVYKGGTGNPVIDGGSL